MNAVNTNHENGNIYEGTNSNGKTFTVFEDNQNGEGRETYYGFWGTFADHDNAEHIDFDSLDDAEDYFNNN